MRADLRKIIGEERYRLAFIRQLIIGFEVHASVRMKPDGRVFVVIW